MKPARALHCFRPHQPDHCADDGDDDDFVDGIENYVENYDYQVIQSA